MDLALRFGGEIVNADSMQVYRGFDIGADKPSPEDRAAVPHHLVDVCDPREQFTAADFAARAAAAARDIVSRGAVPFVVGGTGLYVRALLDGIFPGPGRVPEIRRRLEEEAAARGLDALFARLEAADPDYARVVRRRDRVRIVRALEVYEATGRPFSAHFAATASPVSDFAISRIGLQLDREILNRRIADRVGRMFERGLVEEVRGLLAAGVPETAPPFRGLGYRHVLAALRGEISLAEARDGTVRDTRRYAKRQMTWFRKAPGIAWFAADRLDAVEAYAASRLGR